MLDELKNSIKKIEESKEFKSYKSKFPDSYLTAGFMIYDKLDNAKWQIDFYNPNDKRVTPFELDNGIKIYDSGEVLSKSKQISKLRLTKVKINFEELMKICNKIKKKHGETENKTIVILQVLNDKEVWNLTYLTNSFNILNIKVDANKGDVIETKRESLMGFKAN
tara:strand:- start:13291 stop:13785 length:495 start_codon:yes stop_codon:yes gene_type:complete